MFLALFGAAAPALPQAASAPKPSPASPPAKIPQIPADSVVDHLERTISWYHHVNSVEQTAVASDDILLRSNTHSAALRALQLGFDFAHADLAFQSALKQPDIGASTSGSPSSSSARNIQQVAARADERVTTTTSRLADLDTAIAKAKPRDRVTLEAQRRTVEAQLTLAKEIQKSVGGIVAFASNAGNPSGPGSGLVGQVAELERSVPEARHDKSTTNTAAAPPKQAHTDAAPPRQENGGLISITGEMITLRSALHDFDTLLAETDGLVKNADTIRGPLLSGLRESIRQNDQLASGTTAADLDQLAASQQQITALTARFRQLATVMIPLGEQQIMVETTRANLTEWKNTVAEQYGIAAHNLLVRASTLISVILLILVVSSLWRRAALRYVGDARRRRQFLVIRRVVVGLAITLIVLLSFVSEFGSVATYAGFLTAGLALALQNVILSVVAYFFLIGRYGIRVGDRVTIAGVNGEVIDMGLVRLYMMELAGAPGAEPHTTGRVVVYSNAVLFQPAAIYKQMPGINYAWHTATLTLTPESDFELAEKTLANAVNSVYESYRPVIEKQHAAFEQSVDVQIEPPKPQGHLRFTETGLEFTTRYPVELKHGSDIDAQVMHALSDAVNKEPKLTLAASGSPKLAPGAGSGSS